MVSYLGDNDTLLQNAADVITKYNSCFNTKCGKSLLQNVTLIIRRVDFAAKCNRY